MKNILGMCLDWRVLTSLGLIAAGILVFAPQYFAAALPLLVVLVCPISMGVMFWMMRGQMRPARPSSPADRLAALEHEKSALQTEITQVRAELGSPAARRVESLKAPGD